MYNADSISAQSKLKEAEKQEEKQIGKSVKQEDKQTPRSPDSTSNVKFEEKHVRRSSVKKIEKMKEKQCCDLGYHASLNRALRTFLSAELNLEQSKHEGLDAIENAVENLDANSDKQRLMEMYNNVFCPPMKFEFQPHMGDMVKKTMEATLQTIQDIVTIEDFDVSDCFQYSNSMESVKSTVSETFMSKPSIAKRRANQQETEQFYFTQECLKVYPKPPRQQVMLGIADESASLSYLTVINISYRLPGLQHEGIFRVSGSQVEVNDIKNAFERAMDNLQERALHIRKVLLNLPKTTLIVMRYLFAFLNQ
ncbi:slit-robo rho gtpase-activating protein 2 isoform x2 [Limosa lapponica baueri]|uniref:Slit-robo rho gtpase-activating protein 2 isoform x2 n=1 Tax=Limosa lapponica baueri TaxID=1758121 RepID=A0A2I0TFQ6_LIMLA|nr:slit-robo rho gtpase-activating protein 2 isoform x2 [Limosa lapponica baueri]